MKGLTCRINLFVTIVTLFSAVTQTWIFPVNRDRSEYISIQTNVLLPPNTVASRDTEQWLHTFSQNYYTYIFQRSVNLSGKSLIVTQVVSCITYLIICIYKISIMHTFVVQRKIFEVSKLMKIFSHFFLVCDSLLLLLQLIYLFFHRSRTSSLSVSVVVTVWTQKTLFAFSAWSVKVVKMNPWSCP